MLKKRILLLAALLVLTGCGAASLKEAGSVTVVATTFLAYDWVREIVGDTENVEILWQSDPQKVEACDVFICVGDAPEDVGGIVVDLLEALDDDAQEKGPWWSLQNANTLCGVITGALIEADPDHAETYMTRDAEYCAKLNELDRQYPDGFAAEEFPQVADPDTSYLSIMEELLKAE